MSTDMRARLADTCVCGYRRAEHERKERLTAQCLGERGACPTFSGLLEERSSTVRPPGRVFDDWRDDLRAGAKNLARGAIGIVGVAILAPAGLVLLGWRKVRAWWRGT